MCRITRFFSLTTYSIIAVITFSTSSATATFEEWKEAAAEILFKYEGSDLGKVTSDFDCMGLSLGGHQYPIANGSIKKLFDEISKDELASSVDTYMPNTKDVFNRIIGQVNKGKFPQARLVSLELQTTTTGCPPSGRKGVKVIAIHEQEISSWLRSPLVKEAQIRLSEAKASDALKMSYCWNNKFGDKKALTFSEFMYFFDFLTQAGAGGIADAVLAKATNLIRSHTQYSRDEETQKLQKAKYLEQWFRTDWEVVANPSYYNDAEYNANIIKNEATSKKISYDQLHLLYMRHVRAISGNTPYSIVFMNRGVIDVFGYGRMNNYLHDYRSVFEKMGSIDTSEVTGIACPEVAGN